MCDTQVMKLWPWSKKREIPMDGPPLPTSMTMPDGTVVEGKWTVGTLEVILPKSSE